MNVLLQAYISNLQLEGFALVADLTFVRQSAARLCRALFEIALRRGWAAMADRGLNLCKMVERRMWLSQSPLRQFKGMQEMIVRKLEKKEIAWDRYYDLKPQDLAELVKLPKMGKTLHRLVHQFPRLELSAHVQPITRALLRIELTITPDFQFDPKVHDSAQLFHILVEDVDGEKVLHHEPFMLKIAHAEEEHAITFAVPIQDPLPPQYFLRVVSDRWIHSESTLPVSFRHLILPQKFAPHTELLDLQPLPVAALRDSTAERLYADRFRHFNPIQTQTFSSLYETDENVLVCAPTGSGKTICAEFALLRMLSTQLQSRCVYVAPNSDISHQRFLDWDQKFGEPGLGKAVVELTGETVADLRLLERGQIIVTTAERWDVLSRRWKQRKAVQDVSLFIVDELHLIGGTDGPMLEVVASRMRYISSQLEKRIRVVGLASSIANAKDVGDWLGTTSHSLFSFHSNVRPVPLELYLHGFDTNHFASRLLAMAKPVYNAVVGHAASAPTVVFVPSRKQCQLTAIDLMTYASASGSPGRFCTASERGWRRYSSRSKTLRSSRRSATRRIRPPGSREERRERVEALYRDGVILVVVVPASYCWSLELTAMLVVIMGTETYDGREHRYVDYPVTDMLQMIGKAGRPLTDASGKCVVLCHTPKKEYLKRLLHEPLPVESHLDHFLHDHINAEIVTKTVENKQYAVDYLTWTFYYRRLAQNPNYYNLTGMTHRHLSDHLSELVEAVVSDLEESRCIAVKDDFELTALNLGMIAGYYYIQYTTIELFASSVTAKTKVRGLLEIVASASEYATLAIRHGDDRVLQKLAAHLPQKLPDDAKFTEPHIKALVLLQCHFSREPLPVDLRNDLDLVLSDALRLLQALVDVISSNGWLKPALAVMELSQMIAGPVGSRPHAAAGAPLHARNCRTLRSKHRGSRGRP